MTNGKPQWALKHHKTATNEKRMKSKKQMKEVEDEEKKLEDNAAAAEAPAAKSIVRDGGNDNDDAESSSGSEPPSTSSQGTSGGAGYSGDYSSISDSSETGGSQSKEKKISEPILKNKDGTYAKRARRQKHPNNSMDGADAQLPDDDQSIELMHDYHHPRKHNSRHRQATGSNMRSLYSQDENSDDDINLDINQKISEIMSLYKVSLHAQQDVKNAARAHLKLNAEAAAKQAAEATSPDLPLQVENSQPQSVLENMQSHASQQMPMEEDERKANNGHIDSSDYAHLVEACRK